MNNSQPTKEDMFEQLLKNSPIYVFFKDDKARAIQLSSNFEKMLGKPIQELLGKTMDELFPSDLSKSMIADDLRVLNEGVPVAVKEELNGRFYATTKFPIFEKGRASYLAGYTIDITEQKRIEDGLRIKDSAIESSINALAISDMKGYLGYVNSAFLKLWGYATPTEVLGKSATEFWQMEDKALEIMDELRVHGGWVGELSAVGKNGKLFIVLVSASTVKDIGGNPIRMLASFIDITERKRMEEELQKAQKLEALGLLAGGIAHDFNNLMGGIFGYIDLANCEPDKRRSSEYLSKAINTIDRARALTQQLLTFAKGGAPIQQIGNLFPFVEETSKFALSGANVSCNFDIPKDLWACNFDKNQIGQVIDNLIINAQQAMPVGGAIELTARNITLAEKEHPLLAKGNYVKISVKDAGVGIPKEHISKIFDPFFTTKAKGHGLGLATCYSIINRHGGCIDVESEPGKGSSFHVYLPASMETASSSRKKSVKTHKGSGTFLVMDDEEVMRDAVGDMLETLGYSVVSKENGKEAVDFFASETNANRKITGMIFDLTVPGGMGGKAAIEEIRKLNKDIPAFVASGYADDPVMKKPAEHGFTASICKPFRKVEVSEMLNKYMKAKK